MTFAHALVTEPAILVEGAVIERLRRTSVRPLDPHILHAGWVEDPAGREALATIYREYLDIAERHRLPMLLLSPTWRASQARLTAAGYSGAAGRALNETAVRFLQAIREGYTARGVRAFLGGLLGPRGDAYDPRDAMPADEAAIHHRWQAEALAAAGVDVLVAATLPALPEAIGIACALSATRVPYLLSFVLRPGGTLLDGTLLHEAIARIDDAASPPPLGYLVNCVHPRVFVEACTRELAHAPGLRDRLLGLQANTSDLSPEALDGRDTLVDEDPEAFAEAMLRARVQLGIKLLGGCCGTDGRHIESIARRLGG
jgi:homocysteine S-methyltransferase